MQAQKSRPVSADLEKKFSPGRVSLALIMLWIALIAGTVFFQAPQVALCSLFLGGALPFALLAIWIPHSRPGRFIVDAAKVWQVKIFWLATLFAYTVYAKKWAATLLNELFAVDARYFGVSALVFAILCGPFSVLYRPDVIGWLWGAFLVVAMMVVAIFPMLLIVTVGRPKSLARMFFVFVGFVCVCILALAIGVVLAENFKNIAKRFVVWADFNEKHLCTDEWATQARGVVFLEDSRVLAYFPQRAEGSRFQVVSCDYKKVF